MSVVREGLRLSRYPRADQPIAPARNGLQQLAIAAQRQHDARQHPAGDHDGPSGQFGHRIDDRAGGLLLRFAHGVVFHHRAVETNTGAIDPAQYAIYTQSAGGNVLVNNNAALDGNTGIHAGTTLTGTVTVLEQIGSSIISENGNGIEASSGSGNITITVTSPQSHSVSTLTIPVSIT